MEFVMGFVTGVVSSFWIWPILLCVLVLLVQTAAVAEDGFWSTVWVVIFGGLVYLKWEPIFSSISLLTAGIVLLGYMLCGIAWSFYKWILCVNQSKNLFINLREQFLKKNNLAENFFQENNIGAYVYDFVEFLNKYSIYPTLYQNNISSYKDIIVSITPQAIKKKSSIVMWGVYWPGSILWYLVNDLVQDMFNFVFTKIKNTFQSVANRIFEGV